MHIKCQKVIRKSDEDFKPYLVDSVTAIPLSMISKICVIPCIKDNATDIMVTVGCNSLNNMIQYYKSNVYFDGIRQEIFLWKRIGLAIPNEERTNEQCKTINYSIAGKIARELEQRICEYFAEDEEFNETTTTELCSEGVPQFPKVEPNGDNKGE